MAGEIKLAIVLTATMKGQEAFTQAGGGIKGMTAAIKQAIPMLAMFALNAGFEFLKDSIKLQEEFEQVMAESGSIVGKTADEMNNLGLEIRAMSKVIPKSAADLGSAYYDILSAGILDTTEAMKVLELSAKAASAGVTETAVAAQAGVSTMNAFGMATSDMTHIFDVQFLAVKVGILRYEELAGVIGDIAPSAKASGQSMESMFAAIALLTTKGLDAASAATSLARAYDGIAKPESIKAAAELGISFIEMTEESERAQNEFLYQKAALDSLTTSYNATEASVKSLGEEMAKVSLEEAKNRLEISKIKREAEKSGRELTDAELAQIDALEQANDDLRIQYDELGISQQEAQINATEIANKMEAQQVATEDASKAFDEQVALTGNFRPLVDIIQEINDKYGYLGEAARADIISQMFPEIRARKAIIAIMGSEQSLIDMTAEMTDGVGAMGEAYDIVSDTTAASNQLMQNSMDDLKIEIGEDLAPVMEQLYLIMSDSIVPMIRESFIPLLQASIPVITAMADVVGFLAGIFADYPAVLWLIIGALVAYKTAMMISSVITGITTAIGVLNTMLGVQTAAEAGATAGAWALATALWANPIVWIIAGIIALIAALYLLWKYWDDVVNVMEAVGQAFVNTYDTYIKPVVDLIWAGIKYIIDGFMLLWDAIMFVGDVITSTYNTYVKPIIDAFIGALKSIIEGWSWVWDAVVMVAKGIMNAYMAYIDVIIKLFMIGINLIVDAVMWLWDIIKELGKIFKSVYDTAIKPIVDVIVVGIGYIVDAFMWLWDVIVDLGKIFFDIWKMSFEIPLGLIVDGVDLIVDALQWLWDMIVKVGKIFDDTFGVIVDTIGSVGDTLGGLGSSIGGILGFAEGGVVTSPTLGLLGEAGPEAVIPLKNGSVPVDMGAVSGGGDNITINLNTGVLPQQETPESIASKMVQALSDAKKRGATGQVTG